MIPAPDPGIVEAALRIAADAPHRLAALAAPPPAEVFPAGLHRILWQEVWRRVTIGAHTPLAPDTIADLLAIRGIGRTTAIAWWQGLLERTAQVTPGALHELLRDLAEAHARASLMGRVTAAVAVMRERFEGGATTDQLRSVMASALELSPFEAQGSGIVTIEEADRVSMERERLACETGGETGFTTGIVALDQVLGRLEPGQLTVVAARAKVGKTHAAIQILDHATGRTWAHLSGRAANALVVSLEMDAASVYDRLLARASRTDYQRMMMEGRTHEAPRIYETRQRLKRRGINFVDTPGTTVAGIVARARAVAQRDPVDLLIVDYLDLVRPNKQSEERYDLQVGSIVRDLLTLGRELQAHVVILVQINRQGDQEASIRHLANSDEIGRAAHHVLILNRPQGTDMLGLKDRATTVQLNIAVTSRGRGTGCTIPTFLDKTRSNFKDSDAEEIDYEP